MYPSYSCKRPKLYKHSVGTAKMLPYQYVIEARIIYRQKTEVVFHIPIHLSTPCFPKALFVLFKVRQAYEINQNGIKFGTMTSS